MDDEEVTATGASLVHHAADAAAGHQRYGHHERWAYLSAEQVIKVPSAASTRPSRRFPARPAKPAVTRRQPARPTSTSPSSRRMRSSSIRSTPRRRSSPPENNLTLRLRLLRLSHGGYRQGIQEYAVWHVLQPRQGVRRIYYVIIGYIPPAASSRPRGQRAACAGQCSALSRWWNCRSPK